jgi:hypothetical protein
MSNSSIIRKAKNRIIKEFIKDAEIIAAINSSEVDSSEPEIESVKVETVTGGFVNSTMVVLKVDAKDDVGVTELLLSNKLLTINDVENSEDWVPYTEEVLWRIPEEDKEHNVYVWARDAVGRTSAYGMVRIKLLSQYVGNAGINQTSLKILFQDNNYNFEKNKGYISKIFGFLKEYKIQEPIEFLKKTNLGKYIKYISQYVPNEEIKEEAKLVYKSLEEQVMAYLSKQK